MNAWLIAARLPTLALALSGIILGSLLAKEQGTWAWDTFLLACLCAILFQVLANYANDYGDGVKGTDNNRLDSRMVAAKIISRSAMKITISLLIVLSGLSSIALVLLTFEGQATSIFIYLSLAIFSIWAAINYTLGKHPYGYYGLGDIFVFIFFGLVSVIGSYMLYQPVFSWIILLPAISIGLLCCAVLNLNNMRDEASDKAAGKLTLVVKIGLNNAKIYQQILLILPFLLSTLFVVIISQGNFIEFAFLILLFPALLHLKKLKHLKYFAEFDCELKKMVRLTFYFAILLGSGQVIIF